MPASSKNAEIASGVVGGMLPTNNNGSSAISTDEGWLINTVGTDRSTRKVRELKSRFSLALREKRGDLLRNIASTWTPNRLFSPEDQIQVLCMKVLHWTEGNNGINILHDVVG